MPAKSEPNVVSFDAGTARARIRARASGTVYSVFEFDTNDYNPIYLDDRLMSFYENEQQMRTHFNQIHNHVHMDFMEVNIFENNLFPVANRVEYIVTSMDYLKLLRVYADDEGLFVALERDEPVVPLVDAVRPIILPED